MKLIGEKLYQVNKKDLGKSLILFTLTPLIMSVASGNIPMTIAATAPLLKAGVSAAAAYIVKNFFSNSENEFMKKENESK